MPFSYCTLHERLFNPQCQTWVTWPQIYIAMVPPFCDVLHTAHLDVSHYTVLPTPCDVCTAIACQTVDEIIDPGE